MTPLQVRFRGGNASGGRIVLLPGAFGRTVLPKWPLWAHLFYSRYSTVFQSLGGRASARRVSNEPCFRQAHCFMWGRLRFLSVLPKTHVCPLPHVGFLDTWGLDPKWGRFPI